MFENTEQDNQRLIAFWDKALSLSEDDLAELQKLAPESWKELAPSKKLFDAACSWGKKKKVLDYGCGNAWAGIIAAKSGCGDVTAADPARGAVRAAQYYASVYGLERQLHSVLCGPGWLAGVPQTPTMDFSAPTSWTWSRQRQPPRSSANRRGSRHRTPR